MNKETIQIHCTYFKDTGKYYTDAKESFPVEWFKGCIYPREYGKRLLELGKLPGLCSGTWIHYFTVEIVRDAGSYPELVMPRK